jgi:hypothetical protein
MTSLDLRTRIPMSCERPWAGRGSNSVLPVARKLFGYAGDTHEVSRAKQAWIGCGVKSG